MFSARRNKRQLFDDLDSSRPIQNFNPARLTFTLQDESKLKNARSVASYSWIESSGTEKQKFLCPGKRDLLVKGIILTWALDRFPSSIRQSRPPSSISRGQAISFDLIYRSKRFSNDGYQRTSTRTFSFEYQTSSS
jgi:hypothetical protein